MHTLPSLIRNHSNYYYFKKIVRHHYALLSLFMFIVFTPSILSTASHPITNMLMSHPYTVMAAGLIACEEIFLVIDCTIYT